MKRTIEELFAWQLGWKDKPDPEKTVGPTIVRASTAAFVFLPFVFGCSDVGTDLGGPRGGTTVNPSSCSIPESEIFNGGPGKDGIPALTDPARVSPGADAIAYLRNDDRVIGLDLDGEAVAVPLNVLWWHEIVNLRVGGRALAVTHCPLTGSSLVFDRDPLNGVEFGVSGLLYQTNLLMYDRTTGESLWPQMSRGARCGPRDGTGLSMVAALEMDWAAWRALHPTTEVVVGQARFDYRVYPYGSYDAPSNPQLRFPIGKDIDPRRPPKERVLGIPGTAGDETGGIAFPFGALGEEGRWGVASATVDGREVVVFWDGSARAAMAYDRLVDGEALSFRATANGIVDDETGSVWSVEGYALEGPLQFQGLTPIAEAYVAFWFAWDAFHSTAQLWEP